MLDVDCRFPPAAAEGSPCRLVIFKAEDPEIGGVGFMKYIDAPIGPGPDKHRPRLGQGQAILVIRSDNPDDVYERVEKTSAVVHAPRGTPWIR